MKKSLMLCAALAVAVPQIAAANNIGLYSDASGTSCSLQPGFTSTATVIHRFSLGTTGSRFRLEFPATTQLISFGSAFSAIGDIQSDITVVYGGCLTSSIVVGTLTAILVNGPICVRPPDSSNHARYFDCDFAELPATTGYAMVGGPCAYLGEAETPCAPVSTESSSWGRVKALYR